MLNVHLLEFLNMRILKLYLFHREFSHMEPGIEKLLDAIFFFNFMLNIIYNYF